MTKDEFDILRQRLEKATDLGIYPAATPEGPRTEWQNGWNKAAMEIGDALDAEFEALAASIEFEDTPV